MNTLSYQKCYEILALPNHAQWDQASTSFRQLVHKWHPDRYEGDDPEEATQRYVEITKAHKKLRDFHKENGVMPFSSVESVDEQEVGEPHIDAVDKTNTSQNKSKARATNENPPGDGEPPEYQSAKPQSGGKRSGSNIRAMPNWNSQENFRPSRFAMSIAAVLVVGISMLLLFMTKLDRINSDHYRDEARLQRINEQLAEQPDTYQ